LLQNLRKQALIDNQVTYKRHKVLIEQISSLNS